jgi:hypothetical protein
MAGAAETADAFCMKAPPIIFPAPPRQHFAETEMHHFERLAQLYRIDRRARRREARRERLRALVHRKAA